MKFVLQFTVLVAVFFLMWFGLSRIKWMDTFHIQEFTKKKQEQLAELVLKMHRLEKKEVNNPEVLNYVNRIKEVICSENYIDTATIVIHVFEDKVINAFALPGGHIVVNTELINYSDNVDMLAGVMAHEIAHVELQHVSRKLSREIGLSALLVATGGGEHLGTVKQVLYTLSSRGFDRDMEREADDRAVTYMANAKADPRQLAFFLKKMDKADEDLPEALQWISTHPGTKERVETILKKSASSTPADSILNTADWYRLKELVQNINDR